MGIFTPSDLLLRFPDKYIDRAAKIDKSARDGDEMSFAGRVVAPAKRAFIRRGLSVVNCSFENNGTVVRCSWFNQPFAARNLKENDVVYVVGKVKRFKSSLQMTNPTLLTPQAGDGDIVPVYKTAIPSRTFESAVKTALANVRVDSFIPSRTARDFGLLPLQSALKSVHMPDSKAELDDARRSVAVENMCYVISSYRLLKDDKRDFTYGATVGDVDRIVNSLPYALTDGQRAAVDATIAALRSDKLANMLIQGEVGCGKTADRKSVV